MKTKSKRILALLLTLAMLLSVAIVLPAVTGAEDDSRNNDYGILGGGAYEVPIGGEATFYTYKLNHAAEDYKLFVSGLEGGERFESCYMTPTSASLHFTASGPVTVQLMLIGKTSGKVLLTGTYSYMVTEEPFIPECEFVSSTPEETFSNLFVGDVVGFSLRNIADGKPSFFEFGYTILSGDPDILEIAYVGDDPCEFRFTKPGTVTVRFMCDSMASSKIYTFTVSEKPVTPEYEFTTSIPEEAFSDLWVGDKIEFELESITDGSFYNGKFEYTVLSGDAGIFERLDGYKNIVALHFTKPGTATVQFHASNPAVPSKTYTFHVSERPEPMKVEMVKTSHKLGMVTDPGGTDSSMVTCAKLLNANYGFNCAWVQRTDSSMSNEEYYDKISQYFASCDGGTIPLPSSTRTVDVIWPCELSMARVPGVMPSLYYIEYEGEKVADFPDIVIEEPVITTNLPEQVTTGSSFDLTTALTNTNYQNEKIADLSSSSMHLLGFTPKVEVLEGDVAQSNQDYSYTLASSETLTFQKAGTVRLKITYEPIHSPYYPSANCGCKKYPYSPSTIVTVQVKDKAPSVTADTNKDAYLLGETITATITTPGNVKKAYFVNETGSGLASARSSVVNPDGTITWTHQFALGSIGSRALKVYCDGVDTGATVSFEVTKQKIEDLRLISAAVDPSSITWYSFAATIITGVDVKRVGLFDKAGTQLYTHPIEYEEKDGIRIWYLEASGIRSGPHNYSIRVSNGGDTWAPNMIPITVTIPPADLRLISATVDPASITSNSFSVTVVTGTDVGQVGLFSENGTGLRNKSIDSEEKDGVRIWNLTETEVSSGTHNYYIRVSNGSLWEYDMIPITVTIPKRT